MLQPKRLKWRRSHLIRPKAQASRGNTVAYGDFGLVATEGGYISNRQIEAARVILSRYTKKIGKCYIRIFPYLGITKKPAEVRMGKGKGSPEGFVAPVTPGRVLIEVEGVSYEIAKEALRLAAQKLPVVTKFIVSRDYDPSQNV